MNQSKTTHEEFDSIVELEQQLEKLLNEHGQLIEENETLRREHQNLVSANGTLTEINQKVQEKIEALIQRLRVIEKT